MSEAMDDTHVRKLFMMLHGMYGNKVLDMFRVGQTDDNGEDIGMVSARTVWLNGLREYGFPIVLKAVGRCAERHKAWPPTLPEFRDLCKLFQPTAWSQASAAPRLEMSEALRSQQVEATRRVIAESRLKRDGVMDVAKGLPGLLVLMAKASGYAGGDEIETLQRLERTFARVSP